LLLVDPDEFAVEIAAMAAAQAKQAAAQLAGARRRVVCHHPQTRVAGGAVRGTLERRYGVDVHGDLRAFDEHVEAVGLTGLAERNLAPVQDAPEPAVAAKLRAGIKGANQVERVGETTRHHRGDQIRRILDFK
jgi:hypothetical protein